MSVNQERILKVLLGPLISEKSTTIADKHHQFTFKVTTDATKIEIKQAVEELFKVLVEKVSVVRVKAKVKRFGQRSGTRKAWKKAYVCLKEGYDINFATSES